MRYLQCNRDISLLDARAGKSGLNPEHLGDFPDVLLTALLSWFAKTAPFLQLQTGAMIVSYSPQLPKLASVKENQAREVLSIHKPRKQSTDFSGLFKPRQEPIFGTCESCPQLTHLSSRGRRTLGAGTCFSPLTKFLHSTKKS